MASLTEEERLERLRKHLEMWESLREGVPRSGEISDEQREHALIDSLIPLAAKEIIAAVLEDRVALEGYKGRHRTQGEIFKLHHLQDAERFILYGLYVRDLQARERRRRDREKARA